LKSRNSLIGFVSEQIALKAQTYDTGLVRLPRLSLFNPPLNNLPPLICLLLTEPKPPLFYVHSLKLAKMEITYFLYNLTRDEYIDIGLESNFVFLFGGSFSF
jgi:hypothetical protein